MRYVTVAALVLGAALAVVEPASGSVPKVYSAQYSGTLEIRYEEPPFQGNLASVSYAYQLTWREHASATAGQAGAWTIDELKGSVKDIVADGTGSSRRCSATLAPSGGLGGQAFFGQGKKFVVNGDIPTFLAAARPPSDPNCASVPPPVLSDFETDQGVLAAWAAVEKATVTFPAKGSYTKALDFSWHCPDAGCKGTESNIDATTTWTGTADIELKSRLEFSSPGFVPGSPKLEPAARGNPPSAGPSTDPKALARADLRRAARLAVAPCLGLTLVVGSQTLFTLASPPTASAAGLVADAVVDITADALGQPLLTVCAEELRQIVVDYSVIKRDPPVPEASPPLHPPPCTRWQGKTRAYCQKLIAEARKLVTAERAVLPALKRLESAGMALRNARAKHDAHATASAQAKVKVAAGAVEAARAAARAAGKSAADTVRAAGAQGKLTRKQAETATAAMLDRLAKEGVPAAGLRKLAGSALTAASTDLLAAIAT